jgi:hypothetical protein
LWILQERNLAPKFIVGKATGKIYDLTVDGINVTLSIKTPIMQAEGLARLQRLLQHHAVLLQIYGPEVAMLAYKENELPYLTAQWGGVDLSIVRNKDEMEEARNRLLKSSQAENPTSLGGPSSVKLPGVSVTI